MAVGGPGVGVGSPGKSVGEGAPVAGTGDEKGVTVINSKGVGVGICTGGAVAREISPTQ